MVALVIDKAWLDCLRSRILLAERILGGDTPPTSLARLWRPLRSCTSSRLWSSAASLCLELSTRYEVRLTEKFFRSKTTQITRSQPAVVVTGSPPSRRQIASRV